MKTRTVVALLWLGLGLASSLAACSSTPADPKQDAASMADAPPPPVCPCPTSPATSVHFQLACLCEGSSAGAFLCSRTVADLTAAATCTDGKSAYRNIGCNKVAYEPGRDFAGNVLTYRSVAGSSGGGGLPIGVFQFASAPFGPCAAAGVSNYVYGEVLLAQGHPAAVPGDQCATIMGCKLCGPATDPTAMCM
jgi:hypothetical protein